ncbi:MAG: hypothetical protein ABJC79_07470 [Acidimicrobiia bacterium]
MTTQLRLLTGGDLPQQAPRSKAPTATKAERTASRQRTVWLDARTRQIGRSGVAEARRRLAEINATSERAHDLVKAS